MTSLENKGYWTEQIGVFKREIAEIEAFLNNNQNAVSPEGEDASETMADAETDLTQTKSALRHAKIELARIQQQEEITELLPKIEGLRSQITHFLRQSDTDGAKELQTVLEGLETRVKELQNDPILDDDAE